MNFKKYLEKKGFTRKGVQTRVKVTRLYKRWLSTEGVPPQEATYNDLMAWMQHSRKKGLSQRTIQHYIGCIKHYYGYLLKEGEIIKNPADGLEVKGVKRKTLYALLEPRELDHLYESYPTKTLTGKRNKAVLGLLVYQGLRTEEAGRLNLEDLKLREGRVKIKGSPKTAGRTLNLTAGQVLDLYEYTTRTREQLLNQSPKRKDQQPKQTDKLFIGPGGNLYSFSNLMTGLMKKVKKVNPKVTSGRQIRASVITKWIRQYNLREVQQRAGHRYISSTEGYKQNDMEGLKEEIERFHPLG